MDKVFDKGRDLEVGVVIPIILGFTNMYICTIRGAGIVQINVHVRYI